MPKPSSDYTSPKSTTYTFSKRVGPTKYSQVKHLKYYKTPNPFSVNSNTGGNCTWWAWGRFWEVMAQVQTKYKTKEPKRVSSSNACYFYSDGLKNGYQGGLTPKPGAIICWGYNGKSHGNPGHVAFVEKVNMSGNEIKSIEVSESGWSGGPLKNRTLTPGNGKKGTGAWKLNYNSSYFNGFIYNPVNFGNPAGAIALSGEESGKSKDWYIAEYGNGAEVYFELQKYGYSHKACCAVLGNMQQESGIRTVTNGSYDGNGSEGLCQWTFGRKTAMQKYAAEHSASKTWKSVDGQVAYLVHELETSEKSANKVLQDDSLSLNQMTEEFEKKFERAGVPNMPKRIEYANSWDKKMSGAGSASDSSIYGYIDMTRNVSRLYSSANYAYLNEEEESSSTSTYKTAISSYRNTLADLSNTQKNISDGVLPEHVVQTITAKDLSNPTKGKLERINSTLNISKALIQAPFVELVLGNYTIGSYKNSTDYYPNYITSLDVKKTNGEINQYTINLVYQIRYGEDPNLLDKLFSTVRYNKISIRYGDCESGQIFKDSEAIITNIVSNRDYAGVKITYTIYATSACNSIKSIKFDFPSATDKPSNIINKLLYSNKETSKLLLEAFPGMRDKSAVIKKGFLPTNDNILSINAKPNIDTISYINYLVGCMSNNTNDKNSIIRNSSYFISYLDDKNGSYFKIYELKNVNKTTTLTNNLFEVTVGFPDGNDVYDFKINDNSAWSMLYKFDGKATDYVYDINNVGENITLSSLNLISSTNVINEIQKNWWTQMIKFPITATLSMRGLLKPISLMDYIQINVVFYGQKHITSGLYAITGQEDNLSGRGFSTNLSLIRVGD